ncbi:DUF1534 domain-containing protein [Pseudomonas coronafaciens pv. oryzae str. 1_6]|nr:DUF1534 domain-containing protein [Pseudomonas coronafaciens pv. oryzae str. 1_6]
MPYKRRESREPGGLYVMVSTGRFGKPGQLNSTGRFFMPVAVSESMRLHERSVEARWSSGGWRCVTLFGSGRRASRAACPSWSVGTMVIVPRHLSFITLQRGNTFRDAPRQLYALVTARYAEPGSYPACGWRRPIRCHTTTAL